MSFGLTGKTQDDFKKVADKYFPKQEKEKKDTQGDQEIIKVRIIQS